MSAESNEHKLWLLNSFEGTLNGGIVEMSKSIYKNKEWQTFLNNLSLELIKNSYENSNINGAYSLAFNPETEEDKSVLSILKLEGNTIEDVMLRLNLPSRALGLLHIEDDETHDKITVLSLLAGDYSKKGDFTPNRIFASAVFGEEVRAVRKLNVSPVLHQKIMSVGKLMLNHLDNNLIVQGYNH